MRPSIPSLPSFHGRTEDEAATTHQKTHRSEAMLSPKMLFNGLLIAGAAFCLAAPTELNTAEVIKAQAEVAASTTPGNEEMARRQLGGCFPLHRFPLHLTPHSSRNSKTNQPTEDSNPRPPIRSR